MKAEELMLNDWVECLDSTHKTKVFAQVDAIEESRNCLLVKDGWGNWFLDISHLEPIPLTEEILEKNGLQKLNDKTFLLKNQIEIEVRPKFSEVSARYEDYDRDYNSYNNCYIEIAIINYVHELQHLLRLMGITKEIEL